MHDVGSHADHVDVLFLEEQDVVGQVFHCLSGQSDHDAGAYLVTDPAQVFDAAEPGVKIMIFRVQRPVDVPVAGLNSQQVTMGACVKPALERFGGLFAQRQRDAQFAVSDGLDPFDQGFHTGDKVFVHPFPGLEYNRSITIQVGSFNAFHDFIIGHGEPVHLGVVTTDAAIVTVLGADIAEFHDAPVIHFPAHLGQFHCVCFFKKCCQVCFLFQGQETDQVGFAQLFRYGNQRNTSGLNSL